MPRFADAWPPTEETPWPRSLTISRRLQRRSLSDRAKRHHRPPPSDEAGDTSPLSPGASLFRAFLRAGCDPELAYAAVEEAKMMAGENAAEHLGRLERPVTQHAK